MKGNYIAYYRVSTQRQGRSGLGLEAQQQAVLEYLNGGRWSLVAEFTEVESGKKSDRPELAKALAACKKHKAKLVVAKLDRLTRDLHFLTGLQQAGVPFVVAEMPEATELTIHIMAAVAQHERKLISQRTKAALAAAKKRGVKLGNPNLKADNSKRIKAADKWAKGLKTTLKAYKAQGLSQRAMVEALNEAGVPTRKGGQWSLVQLQRVLKRLRL